MRDRGGREEGLKKGGCEERGELNFVPEKNPDSASFLLND